jgi:ribonuclease PH
MTQRHGRLPDALRPVRFVRGFTRQAPGSVLACFGETQVLCTARQTDSVPPFLVGRGQGWLTAEYAMLPSSTPDRKPRERSVAKPDARALEIQRMIGRGLRSVLDFAKMTERTVWIDCEVLQADGGTRTAAISGAWVALHDLLAEMQRKRQLRAWPLTAQCAAVSVGLVGGQVLCDLDYSEDKVADVDLNLVMTSAGRFVEVQGCAEGATFDRQGLDSLLALGEAAIRQLFGLQLAALELPPGGAAEQHG